MHYGIEFTDDAVLEALEGVEDENGAQGFEFDFDDSDEQIIEEEAIDLSTEMLGSKIQQAAAKILIHAARSGVSDIHVEPRREEYKVRVRRDGVMQSFLSMRRSAGIKFTACLKNMAQMDIAERRQSQDGKIRRRFEGQTMEFRCATAPGKFGEKMVMRFLNSFKMLNLDTLISNEIYAKSQDQSSTKPTDYYCFWTYRLRKSTTLASALRRKGHW